MKKIILALLVALAVPAARAAQPAYTGYLANDPTLARDTNYDLNMSSKQMSTLSAQINLSSTTFASASQTFTDGRTSTGSFTFTTAAGVSSATATDSITVAAISATAATKATNTVTVVSTTNLVGAILTVNNVQLIGGRDWTISNATGTAESIKTLLNSFPGIDAGRGGTVVSATATVTGVGGNAYTMSSSTPTALSVGAANFTGGANDLFNNAAITVDGRTYLNGYAWRNADTSTGTAVSIAALLDGLPGIKAVALGSVVYATATASGVQGNAHTLSDNTAALSTLSANFTGGVDNLTLTVGTYTVVQNVDFTAVSTASGTARAASIAFIGKAGFPAIVATTFTASGILTATATFVGTGGNFALASSSPTIVSVSGAAMSGGSASAYVVNTPTITIASNNFTLALPVLFSTGVVAITNLTNQTTYYVVPIDANNFKLASSTANALAGTVIALGSLSTAGPHTYTLTPTPIAGTPSFKWQESNDCVSFSDMTGTTSFSSPYTSTTTFQDFGTINPVCVRLKVIGPTGGAIRIQAIVNGK